MATRLTLCALESLGAGEARSFMVGTHSVILVRSAAQQVRAFMNRCPHLGVPLNWEEDAFMDGDGRLLRCATHGALFEPDSGLCILGPCRGEHLWQLECHIDADMIGIDADELPR